MSQMIDQLNTSTKTAVPFCQQSGFVLVNPAAGDGQNGEKTRQAIEALLDKNRYQLIETEEDDSVQQIIQEALKQETYQWIAVSGGDGTISQAADVMVGQEIPLLILPGGTANAIGKALGVPQEMEDAVRLLKQPQTAVRSIDALASDDHHYLLHIGVGIEAQALKQASRTAKNQMGASAYLLAAARALLNLQPLSFHLTVDGEDQVLDGADLMVLNTPDVGIMDKQWYPDVVADDGQADLLVVKAKTAVSYLQSAWAIFTGQQRASRQITHLPVQKSVKIRVNKSCYSHGDGESLDVSNTSPFSFEVHVKPHSLSVIIDSSETE